MNRISTALLCTLVFLPMRAAAADIDWSQVGDQAAQLLSAYIHIDTTNPPGNETTAAKFLAERFEQAGVDSQVLESAKGRGFVVARLQGKGEARPVVLLNHLDVVAANPELWEEPPFSGTIRDGYVWGRGAMDCKGVGTAYASAMMAMKRAGIALKRDVIFVATPDEEVGGRMGAGWLAENELQLVRDAEFLLNEGGHIRVRPEGGRAYEVAVSEKTPCWLKLTTTGKAGHGSSPGPETAVTRLITALERINRYQPEIRVVPEVAGYYAALAETVDESLREAYRDLSGALANPQFRKKFLGNRRNAALVRNTITPTVLRASNKTNVIPSSASAEIDCRLLLDEDPERFLQTMKQVVNDDAVTIERLLSFPPSSSPTDTALFRAIETVAAQEQMSVVPSVLTGFTDSHYFREHGIASYGFVPFELSEDDTARMHGTNERLSIENLREGTRRLVEILQVLDQES